LNNTHKKHKANHVQPTPKQGDAHVQPDQADIEDVATIVPDRDLRDVLHHPPPTISMIDRLLDLDAWRRLAVARALANHVSVSQFPIPSLGQMLGRVVANILAPRRRRQREFREVNGVIGMLRSKTK
jgi:hypothetical protein